jgi:GNAT superfamily N-acetyltransferase
VRAQRLGAFAAAAGDSSAIQGKHFGEQLLQAVHNWCAVDEHSQGVVLDTGNPRYLEFYKRQGYEEIGEVAVGPIREHVFFHANPQVLQTATA